MRTKIFVTAGILAIIAAAAVFAGSLDQTNPPGNAAGRMSTLTEIYNCLNTGNCVSKSTGGFAEPGSAPGSTGYTLDDIMTLAKQKMAVPAPVPKTGDSADGATGVNFPNPRFTVNAGTVKDNLTGLIWLKNANCANATRNWATAKTDVVSLNSAGTMNGNNCGDTSNGGSHQTDWRLPTLRELQSLIHYGYANPALSDTAGTAKWTAGNPFDSVQPDGYWSATTFAGNTASAWTVNLYDGYVSVDAKTFPYYVWPVR